MRKRAAGIVGRVNEYALHLARELRLQRLQRKQVIPEDKMVVENIVLRHPVHRMTGPVWLFQQNPRLQLRPVLFANPSEF